jgi:hypothetical protein
MTEKTVRRRVPLWVPATAAGALTVVLLLVIPSTLAGGVIASWTPPYPAGSAIVAQSPATWNSGGGFIKWPVAPNLNPATGKGSSTSWAFSNCATTCPSQHGTDATEFGLIVPPVYKCTAPCTPGVNTVTFQTTTTYNWTEWANHCGPGGTSVNAQLFVHGLILSYSNNTTSGYTDVTLVLNSTILCPVFYTGGATNLVLTIPVTSQFNAGWSYGFEIVWITEVYAACPVPGVIPACGAGQASSEMAVAGSVSSIVLT